jgi:hypothetical protein
MTEEKQQERANTNRELSDTDANPNKESGNQSAKPKSKKSVKKAPVRIESFEELLQRTYKGEFKRVTLTKSELGQVRKALSLNQRGQEELLEIAESDRFLDKTRHLLLLALNIKGSELPAAIREFTLKVLQRHPLFQRRALKLALNNLPEAPLEDRCATLLLSADCELLVDKNSGKAPTKKQCEQCRLNAVECFLLVIRQTRNLSLKRIHSILQSAVWSDNRGRQKTDTEMLYTLLSARDPNVASVTYGLMEDELSEFRRLAERATRAQNRAESSALQLAEDLSESEAELADVTQRLEKLLNDHGEIRKEYETAKAHWKDDFEKLRGQMLYRLKQELALLDEGLHALRRENPKVHVMIDHAERAIDGLKSEMEKLQNAE